MHVKNSVYWYLLQKAIRDININNKLLENKSNIKAGLCQRFSEIKTIT